MTMGISYAFFSKSLGLVPVLQELINKRIAPSLVVVEELNHVQSIGVPSIHIDDPDLLSTLKEKQVDCIIVFLWSAKIPADIYHSVPLGGWNIHPSLLPKYRGASPLFWAIARGDKETGITVHQLTDQFDEGPILLQERLNIQESETLGYLNGRVQLMLGEIVSKVLAKLESEDMALIPQQSGKYTKAPRVNNNDLVLRPDMTVSQCQRLIKASNPNYGSFLYFGKNSLTVLEASSSCKGPLIPCKDGKLYATLIKVDPYGFITGSKFLKLFSK